MPRLVFMATFLAELSCMFGLSVLPVSLCLIFYSYSQSYFPCLRLSLSLFHSFCFSSCSTPSLFPLLSIHHFVWKLSGPIWYEGPQLMPDISNLGDTNVIISTSVYCRIVKPLYKSKYGLIPAVVISPSLFCCAVLCSMKHRHKPSLT